MHAVAHHLRPVPPAEDPLDALFREHHELIYRTAYRITGSAADAEDVLQTVFLRLARRDDGAAGLGSGAAAYLRRAAVNAALDLVRSRKRAPSVALDDIAPLAGAGDPGSLHEDREVHDLIRASVATLSPRSAEIFVLRFFEGYDNAEIAEMLGMSKMVVPVLLHRARARVRRDLGRYLGRNDETNA